MLMLPTRWPLSLPCKGRTKQAVATAGDAAIISEHVCGFITRKACALLWSGQLTCRGCNAAEYDAGCILQC